MPLHSNQFSQRQILAAMWVVVALMATGRTLMDEDLLVYRIYQNASIAWADGDDLYLNADSSGFVYPPQSAVAFLPFAVLPLPLGIILWLNLNLIVFAIGTMRLLRLCQYDGVKHHAPWIVLIAVLMARSSAMHGQMTLIMSGLMMLAMVDLVRQQWWRAAIYLALAFTFKPLAIVLILLVAALYRPMLWRMPLGLAVSCMLPYLTQDSMYVTLQYIEMVYILREACSLEMVQTNEWTHFFSMLDSTGFVVSEPVRLISRLVIAVATLGIAWILKRRYDPSTSAVLIYTVAACYLMLFNPRNERNTFSLLGPAITAMAMFSFSRPGKRFLGWAYVAMGILFLVSYPLGKMLTDGPTVWIKPAVCCSFVLAFLVDRVVPNSVWKYLFVPGEEHSLDATEQSTSERTIHR